MNAKFIKKTDLYFYLYMVAPLLFPVVYFISNNDIVACGAFYALAFICMFFDRKGLIKIGDIPKTGIVGSVVRTLFFPPAYVFLRAEDAGMKKWRWFLTAIAIALVTAYISSTIDKSESIKTAACEITTSIFKDRDSDVKCIVVNDLEKVSGKYYRAKALLTNGVDMPITIEDRGDDYIYVTLAPLNNLID
ncbi:hypothetical protein WKH70_18585 [Pantoea agglomerans]|nr:hypothetical protein [Pantoea agglomerans]